jgi:hypothetical protein
VATEQHSIQPSAQLARAQRLGSLGAHQGQQLNVFVTFGKATCQLQGALRGVQLN